jgi:hypothetical protein
MPTARRFAFLVLAGFALVAAGCGSNNKGKIEGKWKLVSAPGMEEKDVKMLDAFGAYVYFEFTPDGKVNVGADFKDPQMKEAMAKSDQKMGASGTYKLLSGDDVEFSGLNDKKTSGGLFGGGDKSKVKVKIEGDNMTITGSDGTGKFVRVK